MKPEEIRALCQTLQCTARELAITLGIDPGIVRDWQRGERFPTARVIARMQQLRDRGPTAVVRRRRGRRAGGTSDVLLDPRLWEVVQQIVEHPDLLDPITELVKSYDQQHSR